MECNLSQILTSTITYILLTTLLSTLVVPKRILRAYTRVITISGYSKFVLQTAENFLNYCLINCIDINLPKLLKIDKLKKRQKGEVNRFEYIVTFLKLSSKLNIKCVNKKLILIFTSKKY